MYTLRFSNRALADFDKISKSGNTSVQKKVRRILDELKDNPYKGIGSPEKLKGEVNTYSRRLNKKDRIVYDVNEDVVVVHILQALDHYDDK